MPQCLPAGTMRQEFLRDENIIGTSGFPVLLIATPSEKYVTQIPNLCTLMHIHVDCQHKYASVELQSIYRKAKLLEAILTFAAWETLFLFH